MLSARILLVEDDASLNVLIERYLTRQGHSVDSCVRGEAAWQKFSADTARYDLVIADLTLPDLPGEVLVGRILESSPSTPVLICSGAPDPGTYSQTARVSFLQKPFLPQALAESVQAALSD